MRKILCVIVQTALLIYGLALAGCQTTNNNSNGMSSATTQPSDYTPSNRTIGNGAYGEPPP
jgi:hypothetical protein